MTLLRLTLLAAAAALLAVPAAGAGRRALLDGKVGRPWSRW
jgi:hypothetical protein